MWCQPFNQLHFYFQISSGQSTYNNWGIYTLYAYTKCSEALNFDNTAAEKLQQ